MALRDVSVLAFVAAALATWPVGTADAAPLSLAAYTFPSGGPISATGSGSTIQAGGRTWNYSVNTSVVKYAYWTAQNPQAGLNGTNSPMGLFTYGGTTAEWRGTTTWDNPDTSSVSYAPADTRFIATSNAGSWGVNSSVPAPVALNISGLSNFNINWQFQGDTTPTSGATGWQPLGLIEQFPSNQTQSSITGIFYTQVWEDLSATNTQGGGTVDFGTVDAGGGTVLRTSDITLANIAAPNSALDIFSYTITGAQADSFSLLGFSPFYLFGGQNRMLDLAFDPLHGAGSYSALLTFQTSDGTAQFNLTAEAASAVPEPATLALMGLGGIGLIGGAARKRRKTTVAA